MDKDHKILIIKPSSLGDIIHAFPALSIIRKSFPTSYIAWLINDNFKSILEGHPYLDEIIAFPRYLFLKKGSGFLKELKARRFDITIDLQGLLRSALISFYSGAGERIGFRSGRELSGLFYTRPIDIRRDVQHAVDRNVHLASSICGGIFDIDFAFNISHRAAISIEALLHEMNVHDEIIAMSPATRWPSKMWIEHRWAAVADELSEKGTIFFLGGPGEEGIIKGIMDKMKRTSFSITGKLTLQELAAFLSRSRLLITVDNGIMHLASALHVPVVSLFGPTDPARCGPYGQDNGVIMPDIDCKGCYNKKCNEMKCMQDISADMVLSKAKHILNK